MAGSFERISMSDYLGDLGRTSASDLSLVERDPRLYRNKLLGKRRDEQTPAMALGSYVHAVWLEGRDVVPERFAFAPSRADIGQGPATKVVNRTTKEGKAAWAEFTKGVAGRTIILPDQQPVAEAMLRALVLHPLCRDLKGPGFEPEVTAWWEDEETGEQMRARFDGMRLRDQVIVELKTVERLDPESGLVVMGWIRQGWARKSAIYHDAYHAITGKNATVVWVLVETTADEPRIAVVFNECDSPMAELGRRGSAAYGLGGYRDLIRSAQAYRETNDYRQPWEREPLGRFNLPFGLETSLMMETEAPPPIKGARRIEVTHG